jgi:HSP20 family protein
MAILRWDPTRDLSSLQSEMNRVFSSFFDSPANQSGGAGGGGSGSRWLPAMDLSETGDSYVLHADLPGMSEDDVQIELEDNVLTISGERRLEESKSEAGYLRTERARGSFARSLTLPAGIDPERIEADFQNGVLELHIPKPEQRKPRRISIGGTAEQRTIEGHESNTEHQADTNGQRQEEYSTG